MMNVYLLVMARMHCVNAYKFLYTTFDCVCGAHLKRVRPLQSDHYIRSFVAFLHLFLIDITNSWLKTKIHRFTKISREKKKFIRFAAHKYMFIFSCCPDLDWGCNYFLYTLAIVVQISDSIVSRE